MRERESDANSRPQYGKLAQSLIALLALELVRYRQQGLEISSLFVNYMICIKYYGKMCFLY